MPSPNVLPKEAKQSRAPVQIEPASTPSYNSIFALQVGVVVIAGLYLARDVLIPITAAGLLSFLLAPLVSILRRLKIGRIAAIIVATLLAIGILLAIGAVIGTQLASLLTQLPEYVTAIQVKIGAVGDYVTDRFSGVLERLGWGGTPDDAGSPASPLGPSAETSPAEPEAETPPPAQEALSPMTVLTSYVSSVLSPFATAGIMLVVAVFILLQKEDLRDRMIRLFGSSDLHRTTIAMDDAATRLSRYFLTLLAINTGFGLAIGIGLFLIGVPNPILWGILGTTLRFVPYVGPIIAAVLPIALAAAVDPGWTLMLWTGGLFIVTELVFNQVVEPVAYGQSTGLSPVSVIFAALFWGWLWGPIGLILSMPLTLCLVVLGRHVERLEFLDVLLGDRPALTPAESFYQRMLAGDPDEAQDHAELLLQERALSSYYDEVALKGLQLAVNDLERGVLRPDQLERIRDTTIGLIEELADVDDVAPAPRAADNEPAAPPEDDREMPAHEPPRDADKAALAPAWQDEAPVLCLAGRGPLDEAASAMLAQLLEKHGLGGRLAPHEAASRYGIRSLDMTGVAMICVSYLEISGSPAHLRYLIRRLKEKAPGIPILVGLWPAEDSALDDKQAQNQIGADFFTTSLREAVNACVEVAHDRK
jgi:predicted PurR-regulated permease PerM